MTKVNVVQCVLAFGLIACMAMARGAEAQVEPCTPGVRSPTAFNTFAQPGSPYSATLKMTYAKRLSDGTLIEGTVRTRQARETNGTLRMETSLGCDVDEKGVSYSRTYVRIADPVAGTYLDWMDGVKAPKTATLRAQPVPQGRTASTVSYVVFPTPGEQVVRRPDGRIQTVVRVESLGGRVMEGVTVEGYRLTSTIPPGAKGNEVAIVSFTEMWQSKDLGIVMAAVSDDPERGRTEMVVEDFSRAEPDRALFAPPPGVAIKDVRGQPGQ